MSISIVNGRLLDPAHGIDDQLDLHLDGEVVVGVGHAPAEFVADEIIDATGCVVAPGLVDLAACLREPGFEHKATLASEAAAAARGGITTLLCTPDTNPVIDNAAVVELIHRMARKLGQARILATGALTRGLNGEQLSEMASLRQAGCVAVSNAHYPLCSTLVERRALEYATTFGLTVFLRPEDRHLRAGGCAHEGAVATRLGLPAIPSAAESVAVARDLALAEHCQAKIHFRALSTMKAARMLAEARAAGILVTADVAAHQLHLTEMDVDGFDARCHVSPPLRTLGDRDALRRAVADGTIAAICSDHQPHEPDAKERPFPETEPGISGLETLLGLTLRLVEDGTMDLMTALARVTSGPADILGLPYGRLGTGSPADIIVFDLDRRWTLDTSNMLSEGRNTPFDGWDFPGSITHTIFNGRVVYRGAATA
ncbi:MAG: dihydroorotase [Chromatiaceae bacterium]|nr:dihydroorotase [Gammaproteobacteria bacterium]MCP5300070.1 dihydroorotase [Chromatiaceae bacterium]MCP5422142.1 dihydroorotase [Chromatiaceae bacterium]